MSTTFPASKQEFTNPTVTSKLNSPSHSTLHSNMADTIEAIEDKLGTTGSLISGCGGLYPGSDSTTAIKLCQSDGTTPVMTIDTTNKRIGINTTAALVADFTIEGTGGENLYIERYGNTANPPSIKFWKARGTVSVPTVASDSDDVGKIEFWAYARNQGDTANAFVRTGMIISEVDGVDAQGRIGGRFSIYTSPGVSVTPSLIMTIGTTSIDIEKIAAATAGTQYNSYDLRLRGSVWDTDNTQAEDRDIYARVNAGSGADGAEPYDLTFYDNSDNAVLVINPLTPTVQIQQYLGHIGDPNTALEFAEDRFKIACGGVIGFDFLETTQDVLYIGNGSLGVGGTDIDVYIGTNNSIMVEGSSGNIYIAKTGTADAGTQYPSQTLYFTASVWDTSNTQAEDRTISIKNVGGSGADGSEPYYLSFLGNSGGEFLRIDPVSSAILIPDYLMHLGDTNTWIQFTTDQIELSAGGGCTIRLYEASGDSYIQYSTQSGALREKVWRVALNDEATDSLDVGISESCFGWIIADNSGTMDAWALFILDGGGNVTLVANSANVVANADTDTNLCIGTAAAQEPLTIKNRLGGSRNIHIKISYY